MLEYETLRVIWWLLIGVLLGGFAILDGFDFGSAALLTTVARNDTERRVVINSIGPIWESNQVWFILGGGAIFAAWPFVYEVSFSGFYLAMMLVLLTLICRPASFKYRSKVKSPGWRYTWDWILCICGILTGFVFGVAIGNVFEGIPFYFDDNLRVVLLGGFWSLFHWFPIVCGIGAVAMFCLQGGLYLGIKTTARVQQRAILSARIAGLVFMIAFIVGGLLLIYGVDGYVAANSIDPNGVSNPLHKSVVKELGAWYLNYANHPWFFVFPALVLLSALWAMISANWFQSRMAFVSSSITIACVFVSLGIALFPFILPSSSTPGNSLLVWDASASQLSLTIMTIATVIFMPIILAYVIWVYYIVRGKVTGIQVTENKESY